MESSRRGCGPVVLQPCHGHTERRNAHAQPPWTVDLQTCDDQAATASVGVNAASSPNRLDPVWILDEGGWNQRWRRVGPAVRGRRLDDAAEPVSEEDASSAMARDLTDVNVEGG